MLSAVATGLVTLSLVLVAWVTAQIWWRRAFPAAGGDPDALAGRLGCGEACLPERCDRSCPADTEKEEDR